MPFDHELLVAETAVHPGGKRDTNYMWIEPMTLPAHKVGSLWKFRRNGKSGLACGRATTPFLW